MRSNPDSVFMLIDPETREAYRGGTSPRDSGPLFFTSEATAERYATEANLESYELYTVPTGVLERLKGKPHWIDGKPQATEKPPQSRVRYSPGGGKSE